MASDNSRFGCRPGLWIRGRILEFLHRGLFKREAVVQSYAPLFCSCFSRALFGASQFRINVLAWGSHALFFLDCSESVLIGVGLVRYKSFCPL